MANVSYKSVWQISEFGYSITNSNNGTTSDQSLLPNGWDPTETSGPTNLQIHNIIGDLHTAGTLKYSADQISKMGIDIGIVFNGDDYVLSLSGTNDILNDGPTDLGIALGQISAEHGISVTEFR